MQSKLFKNVINKSKDSAKTIAKHLPELPLPSSNTKIAITGLSRSGKTVFITSLIDQLMHQDKLRTVTPNNSIPN